MKTLGTEWLEAANAAACEWPERTLEAVAAHFPYPPERGVRAVDWVELVAHVSQANGEDPIQTAERLALYVQAYREAHQVSLTPTTLMKGMTP